MKYFLIIFFCVLPIAAQASFFDDDSTSSCASAANTTFETAFSGSGATLSPLVVKELASATKSIRVAAHGFTSKPVSEALVKAAHGGKDVKVLLDAASNQSVYSAAQFLTTMSFPPHLAQAPLSADYVIIDDRDIILGTIAGLADEEEEQKTNGSVLVIHNAPDLAKQYIGQWQALWGASKEMKPEKN